MKLQTFHAWGMVTVKDKTIVVILSAVDAAGQPIRRTLKSELKRDIPAGSAMIAVAIETDAYRLQAHELDETHIATHPEVVKVIARAVDWIKKSE